MVSKEFLEEQYFKLGKTFKQIANETEFTKDQLKYAMKKFGLKARGKHRISKDITGQRFGSLVAIEPADKRNYWKCKCDCGKDSCHSKSGLVGGDVTRCWSCRNEYLSTSKYGGCGELSGDKWYVIRRGATLRKIPFEITIEYAWQIYLEQDGKCVLTGQDIVFNKAKRRPEYLEIEETASLDRIDSKKGYVEGNVQWVHKNVNCAKWALNNEEFIELCRTVVEYDNLKKESLCQS